VSIDLQELRGYISEMYADVARFPRGDFHFPTGRPLLEALGYPADALDRIPGSALESFAGVGYHFDLDPPRSGERTLDVGAGAGTDVFYAALAVGEGGSATGIDMTDAMLEKARATAARAGLAHVRFEQGYAEELPFEDAAFDAVTSNGVINLSPRKDAVFREIRRVLKPGGRLMLSDIVTGVVLPESVRDNCELWAECIGGAEEERRYLRLVEEAGLRIERVRPNERYAFTKESTLNAARKFQVRSIGLLAYRV
jgi:SAM-dependent methyltransferase